MKRPAVKIVVLLLSVLFLSSCGSELHFVDALPNFLSTESQEDVPILEQYNEFSFISSEDMPSAEVIGANGDVSVKYTNEYNGILLIWDVPYLYNEKTGELGCLCTDPLCFHNTRDCPYFGMISGVVYVDHKAYYESIELFDVPEPVHYYNELNLKTGRKRELRSRPIGGIGVSAQLIDSDSIYYYDVVGEDDSTGKTVKTYFVFMRQDLKTLKTEELSRTEEFLDTVIWGRFGDTALFFRESDGNLLTAPMDNLSEQTVLFDRCAGSWYTQAEGDTVFFTELTKDGGVLSSIRIDGTGYRTYPIPTLFDQGAQPFYVTGKYIYYLPNEPVRLPSGCPDEYLSPRTIWRMNRETEEIMPAYTLDERLDRVDMDEFIVKGNYIYVKYALFTEDFQGIDDSEGYLRLGIEDGSIYLIKLD